MAKTIPMIAATFHPEDLIIPARDSKGQSERIWFKVSPDLERVLSVIHSSKKFPFKTIGDQVRCYVHHGAKWAEKHAGVETVMQRSEMMIAILKTEDEQQRFQDVFDSARKVVNTFVSSGDNAEARRVVSDLKTLAQKMPPGYWRTKYLKAITDTFGHLLDGKQHAVSLRHFAKAGPDDEE